MAAVAPMRSTSPLPIHERKCFFIQRDYSKGLTVCWHTDFPTELVRIVSKLSLKNQVDDRTWSLFIKELNDKFDEAGKTTWRSVMETLLGLTTCYVFHACTQSSYAKQLEDISDFIDNVNDRVFNPRGVHISNPMEHGMRVMEISLLFIKKDKPPLAPPAPIKSMIVARI